MKDMMRSHSAIFSKNMMIAIGIVIGVANANAQTNPGNNIYTESSIDEPAYFEGGRPAFNAYLDKNIKKPAVVQQGAVRGIVYLQFVVEKDGSLTDIRVTRGFGYGCSDEALRLMKASPKWQPGKKNGVSVRQLSTREIHFGSSDQPRIFNPADQQLMDKIDAMGGVRIDEPVGAGTGGKVDPNEIYNAVEQMAEYPGGLEAFNKYVEANLKYPAQAKSNGVSGRVFVTFVVETDGSLTNLKILRGIGSGCEEEAVRLVKASAKWHPGKMNGQAVRQQYTLPIHFDGAN